MSGFNWLREGEYFIYAEYCPGLFGFAYMGWWLYAAPIENGKPNKQKYVWLHSDWELDAVMVGLDLPRLPSYVGGGIGEYTKAFRDKYPDGVLCKVEGYSYYCKVKIAEYQQN